MVNAEPVQLSNSVCAQASSPTHSNNTNDFIHTTDIPIQHESHEQHDNLSYQSTTPRFDQLPIEVLSTVASLLAPPFYPPPPEEHNGPLPPAHVVASLDPHPPLYQTVPQGLSAITKTCAHVLESTRPWLWENVDVRSGRGWLAVVNALTEEVVDDEPGPSGSAQAADRSHDVEQAMATGMVSPPPEPNVAGSSKQQPTQTYITPSGINPNPFAKNATASSSSSWTPEGQVMSPVDASTPAALAPSQPIGQPFGLGKPSSMAGRSSSHRALTRSVTIDARIPEDDDDDEIMRRAAAGFSPLQPRRLSMLITPPGSRAVSPHARIRGRSRSPRRGLNFETEGITAVLQRSLSLSLPGGGARLQRHSSLSVSRVFPPDSDDETDSVATSGAALSSNASPRLTTADNGEEPYINANPDLLPPPGPYIRHLTFSNFKTIGSRRSQEEAVRHRFVTGGRLEGVIKNTPNLRSICMTEYVDSALTYPVLEEIFFRGYPKPRLFRSRSRFNPADARARSLSVRPPSPVDPTLEDQLDPPRPQYVPYEEETDAQKWNRRNLFTPLEAIDLSSCVSKAFTDAIDEFGDNWLGLGIQEEEEERGRSRRRAFGEEMDDDDDGDGDDDDEMRDDPARPLAERRTRRPKFTALRRLSLRACTTIPVNFLQGLIVLMPNLTHLDLSATRVSDGLLRALTAKPPRGMRLQSLSLARCPRLSPNAVVDFLIDSPAASDLIELNLFVNPTQGNAMESEDLMRLVRDAPCFQSGRLRYLDLSSAGCTSEHLSPDVFPPQPSLVSLGLSHIPMLRLRAVAQFIQTTAPGVEILTLAGSCLEDLNPTSSTLSVHLNIHTQLIKPLTDKPFSIGGLDLLGPHHRVDLSAGATRLRVIELSWGIRSSLTGSQGGKTEWQVVNAKSRRGWYVDVSAGWIPTDTVPAWGYVPGAGAPEVGEGIDRLSFVRHLPATHPRRRWLAALAEANGNVRVDVGWHSRKMEVVRGEGMLGRQEGMGSTGAFDQE